jgi:hypothetical protein
MKPKEIEEYLERHGIDLSRTDLHSLTCFLAFCAQMESRQYGISETANAFAWFESGWKCAAARLE